jgi:hypothetical protein
MKNSHIIIKSNLAYVILLYEQKNYPFINLFIFQKNHYWEMHLSSLWVSLDFERIWTFLPTEIV